VKLPELEQSLLRAARESLSPAASDRQRHEAALLSRLDLTRGSPAREAHAASSETGLRAPMRSETREIMGTSGLLAKTTPHLARSRLELLSAGLAVGMAFGGVVGFVLGRSGQASPEPKGLTSSQLQQPGEGAIRAEPKARGSGEQLAQVEDLDTASATEHKSTDVLDLDEEPGSARAITTRRLKPARARAPEKAKPESSLAIELSMLQRARRALGADNGRLALGIVQELEERFPKGVLMEERRATRVLSLCLLGRTDEARRIGREFLAQHGSSVYAERVRASCAVDGR
jgi:hypothetical protein